MTWFCSKISPSEVVHLVQYSRGELNRHAIVTLLNTPLSAFDSNIIRVRMHVVHHVHLSKTKLQPLQPS